MVDFQVVDDWFNRRETITPRQYSTAFDQTHADRIFIFANETVFTFVALLELWTTHPIKPPTLGN
jgi:hypothetical protein